MIRTVNTQKPKSPLDVPRNTKMVKGVVAPLLASMVFITSSFSVCAAAIDLSDRELVGASAVSQDERVGIQRTYLLAAASPSAAQLSNGANTGRVPTGISTVKYNVYLDTRKRFFDNPMLNVNGRTYLAVRDVGNLVGATTDWDSPIATVTRDTQVIEIIIGSNQMVLNGQQRQVDSTDGDAYAFIYEGRTYLPMRVIAEALGMGVLWDAESSRIIMTSDGSTPNASDIPVDPYEDLKADYQRQKDNVRNGLPPTGEPMPTEDGKQEYEKSSGGHWMWVDGRWMRF